MELISHHWLKLHLTQLGINEPLLSWLAIGSGVILALIVARAGLSLGRRALHALTSQWRDVCLPDRLAHLVPLFLLTVLALPLLNDYPTLAFAAETLLDLYLLLVVGLVFDALLNLLDQWLENRPYAHRIPHQGLIQLAKMISTGLLLIFALAVLLDKSPMILLSGLGAISAITLLVFKDTILGFVAGVQLSANDMLRRGDWIEMPKYGADGDVQAITLSSVKVQNWDKTITTIPAYALISDAFKNWRGMENSGGRRIKRAVILDINSVQFLDSKQAAALSQLPRLRPWLEAHQQTLSTQTNVAALRAYLEAYLRQHENIHQQMTLLVRHLPNNGQGLPIEIYCFSSDQRWAHYEALQAEILEHVYASLPLFSLSPFQVPTGRDLDQLAPVKQVAA